MARSVVDWAHLNLLELHPNLVQLGGDDEEKAAPFATEMNSNFEALKGFWKVGSIGTPVTSSLSKWEVYICRCLSL